MNCLDLSRGEAPLLLAAPLVFPACPISGESISETILRAAALNAYQKAGYVLSAAGISYQGNLSVAAKAQGREEDLAITLGVPDGKATLQRIIPYPVPNRPGWSDFFGVPLRVVHRDMKYRRISPRSLRQSLHLKAIWSVKVFSFDPWTKEQLLDRCPECSRHPTYLGTFGLQYCEFCSTADDFGFLRGRVDFRDYPQPIIEVGDMDALDFVTDLVDPERQRDFHIGCLHGDLNGFGPSDLFELVVAVACALTCPPSWNETYLRRPSKKEDYARLTPEVLAAAGRTILNWPVGFYEIAEKVRASAPTRSGYYSVRKELAPLVALTRDHHIPSVMRSLIRSKIKQNAKGIVGRPATLRAEYRPSSDFIPLWEAAPRFATAEKTILKFIERGHVESVRAPDAKKSPVLVNCRELEAILELSRSTMEARSVAGQLGIPRQFLKGLVEKGYIVPVARHDVSPGAEFYSKKSVEELKSRCRAIARDDFPPTGAVRISAAVSQLRLGPRAPWGGIVERILKGEMEIWAAHDTLSIAAFVVRNRDCLEGLRPTDQTFEDDVIFSQGEAGAFLDTTAARVNQLVRGGLLSASLTARELRSFSEEHAFTPEVVEMLALKGIKIRKREILPTLRAQGIEPRAAVNGSSGYVWRRADICPLEAQERTRCSPALTVVTAPGRPLPRLSPPQR